MKSAQSTTGVVPAERLCPRCGVKLGGFGPEGLCGACLIGAGLEEEESATSVAAPASQLRRLGGYELLEEIARGGMGVVYRARQASLNRIVAVKMILRGGFAGTDELARFHKEAEAAAHLKHPNIVGIHEVGEHDGHHFFSMELVEGRSLSALVREGPLPAAQAARYVEKIARAVHYAHEQGILHRDLKPSNVLVDANDEPHVTDFGLAKRLTNPELETRSPELTLTGMVMGTPSFMPPEQAAPWHDQIGPRSDVYSLGAILYHLLTGRPPFAGPDPRSILNQVLNNEVIAARLLNPTVPRDLETICLKCLEKEPRQRYASAQVLADDLGRYLNGEPVHARAVGPAGKAARWCRRKPALAGALAACAVVLVSGIAGITWQWRRAEHNAARNQRVAQFLKDILADVERSVRSGQLTLQGTKFDRNVERLGKDLEDQPAVEAALRQSIGDLYLGLGQYAKAELMFRRTLDLRTRLFGSEHPDVPGSLYALAIARDRQHTNDAEAVALLRAAVAVQKKLRGNEDLYVAHYRLELAEVLQKQHKYGEAAAVYHEAIAVARRSALNDLRRLEVRLFDTADLLYRQGSYAQAEPFYRGLLDNGPTRLSIQDESVHESVLSWTASLGRMLSDWAWEDVTQPRTVPGMISSYSTNMPGLLAGATRVSYERAREAEALLGQCLAAWLEGTNASHWRTADVKSRLGGAVLAVAFTHPALSPEGRQVKLAEAEVLLLEGNRWLLGNRNAYRKYQHDSLQRLVRLYNAWEIADPNTGKSDQAQVWARRLEAFRADGGDGLEKYKDRTANPPPQSNEGKNPK